MSRIFLIALTICDLLVPYRMLQAPGAVDVFPEMIRTPAVNDLMELLLRDGAILQKLLEVLLRKFAVVALDQRDAFLPGDFAVPDLVRRVGGRPADAEFDIGQIIVIAVDAVIEARIFGVRTLGTLGIRREIRYFRCSSRNSPADPRICSSP